ncbi:AAA family ATPase [Sphingomonas sp. UBA978]|uniref:AAA family ATPase n=1 Tax=Sphingomonas sp. UBA978 TaxID=1947536 RepID=UPI0025EE3756|nr:AAA family ATPase [Sphingomonas sp. UBA978]
MTAAATDFAALMPTVAPMLLGDPNTRLSSGTRLRFGSKGSVEVETTEGWFDDHEAKVRGGVLELIQHKRGCNMHGALSWLEEKGLKERSKRESEKTFYDYCDASGTVAYRVERRGKDAAPPFLQHGPDGNGGFRSARGCMQGVAPLPYRLPELLASDPAAIVFVCEGEKDADRLARDGLVATTNSGGAGKFVAGLAPHFAGRRVVVLADNDPAGEAHALDVEQKLTGLASEVAILRLPDLPPKGDVSDWLRAQGAFRNTIADLEALAAAAFTAPKPEAYTFPIADLTMWANLRATPKAFALAGLIPSREVTLLTGAGGANKSTFGQQLATCAAAGVPMLAIDVHSGPALYITAEDDDDRLHWMQEHICKALRVPMAGLAGKLHLTSLRGRLGNELALFDSEGRIRAAPSFGALRATIEATRAGLVVLDNVAHLFAGNENDRGQVTAFVNLLYSLCVDLGTTVVLIGHPNKSGDSYSGSTAWLNAVRSQIVLEKPEGAADPDVREIKLGKANYARMGDSLSFRWHDFALIRDDELPADRRAELSAVIATSGDNAAFLACLDARTKDGMVVSPNVSPNYAPAQFEAMPLAKGIGKVRLRKAMERLLEIGEIEVFDHEKKGKGVSIKALRRTPPDAPRTASRTLPERLPERSPNAPEPLTPNDPPHTPTLKGEAGAGLGASAPAPSPTAPDLTRVMFPGDDREWSTGWGEGG